MWSMMFALLGAAPVMVVAPPVSLDDRLQVELVAANPAVVTPVGLAIDRKGRLFVVESHTHERKDDYAGPPHDRVKVLEDIDGDGRFEKQSIFAEGLQRTMHVALSPEGRLYATQRDAVLLLEDRDGDGKAESRTPILTLETKEVYPHNGLGALVFGQGGWLYVGMGENFGNRYTLVGKDGRKETGEGDGGNLFRCRPDGTRLERLASGFWNPFAMAFLGRYLLVADNDPDARPPNRLLDVITGGDYGFRFRNGRDGVHPFQAWNGEVPGTLPMVGPVGEAASGMLVAAEAKLPGDYDDTVLVTSWGDHRIEAHKVTPAGGSVRAVWKTLVKGGDDFRPVGIAAAPDGRIYFTDWVDRSYNVHGKGRIWRLSLKKPLTGALAKVSLTPPPARVRVEQLLAGAPSTLVLAALDDGDPFVRAAATTALGRPGLLAVARRATKDRRPRVRLGAYLALRRSQAPGAAALVPKALDDTDEAVRTAALIWAAEDRPLGKQARAIDRALARGGSPELVRVYAAAAERLGVPIAAAARAPGEKEMLALLATPASSPAQVQRQRNTLWRLAGTSSPAAPGIIKAVALDGARDSQLRADAVAVLALLGLNPGGSELEKDADKIVAAAAHRAFRQQNSATVRPSDEAGWRRALAQAPGNIDAGRRVFFHPGIGCYRCHRVDGAGAGADVGPDLSTIARGMDTTKLVESILLPSKEIAPENATRVVATRDGRTLEGLLVKQPDGSLLLRAAASSPVRLAPGDIETETRSDVSAMPEGLQENMTPNDFRDLIAFLASRR